MPASPVIAPPLFVRLRAATANRHAALEARLDVLERFRDRDAYARYLARAHPLYREVENALARHDWNELGLDFDSRRKAALIRDDLAALGMEPEPAGPLVPEWSRRAAAIGALYVLEGATLGGQVISRHLKSLGLEPGQGASFFNAYGPRTGDMWKAFQESATRGVRSEGDAEPAVAGALAMFDLFAGWMAG